ncbi:NLI interacting factor-like phosphatase-domain-containing protein [Pyronema omphalodes]|nr:NLI interacting factor-like phosphatase-domain-containing protein [Pyronema omphalodes]
MNSLSILSSRVNKVIGNTPPTTPSASNKGSRLRYGLINRQSGEYGGNETEEDHGNAIEDDTEDEAAVPGPVTSFGREGGGVVSVGERIYLTVLNPWFVGIRWIISTIAVSTNWLVACLHNDEGNFSPLMPLRRTVRLLLQPFRKGATPRVPIPQPALPNDTVTRSIPTTNEKAIEHRRTKSFAEQPPVVTDDISPRRSIRIQLYREEGMQKNKALSAKSPTSPNQTLRLTKYPRTSGPPVPLLSRKPSPKTLILDLDETLIHSLARGGRMSSGHMVEVKLDKQHAVLYYVHKRPYCDEFLRKVAKWYNLVVFTASVQEYADPVIDWLEQDRKYFKGRFYRQHCSHRNGAYIKDLATVEPDLSKVIIIDNSPMSYTFHEDNAIPIEGWINDPTDIDLLNLIPMLQALQYVADVRALLALRMGECRG